MVDIITKRPTTMTGQIGIHTIQPEGSREGASSRANVLLAGPIGDRLTFHVHGNYSRSQPDDPDLPPPVATADGLETNYSGREGVETRDLGALLTWLPIDGHEVDFDFTFSRQGNEFAGEASGGGLQPELDGVNLLGVEMNRMLRRTLSAIHRSQHAVGTSTSYLQWENTRNTRNGTSAVGSSTDKINSLDRSTITYDSIAAKTEWALPTALIGRESMVTLGTEYRGEFLDNENATGVSNVNGGNPTSSEQHQIGAYVEANILATDALTLTPGLRADWDDSHGTNLSPSLNADYRISDGWTAKLGVARAFKAPNLFQLSPN